MAEEGWLQARREGRRSRYALDPATATRFQRAYQRVYAPVSPAWDGRWTVVLAPPGTDAAEQRADLRKELLWQGFGAIAPLVFGHPSPDAETLEEILGRTGAKGNAFVCHATESDLDGARPLEELIGQCWDLRTVIADYERLLDSFGSLPAVLDSADPLDPRQAFLVRTLLVHQYRRARLHDPQLPLELLPKAWPGKAAYELCRRIYRASSPGAERHVMGILRAQDADAPEAAPYFHQRFG
ncbi:MAG: PaaX family transcriptional regulator C-terminal domain-containing protein [Gammaproteobacteria bacterium]